MSECRLEPRASAGPLRKGFLRRTGSEQQGPTTTTSSSSRSRSRGISNTRTQMHPCEGDPSQQQDTCGLRGITAAERNELSEGPDEQDHGGRQQRRPLAAR